MKPGPFCVDKMCRNRYTRRCSILSESFWLTPGRNVLLASKEPESDNHIFFASWSTSRSTIQVGCRSCMILRDYDWDHPISPKTSLARSVPSTNCYRSTEAKSDFFRRQSKQRFETPQKHTQTTFETYTKHTNTFETFPKVWNLSRPKYPSPNTTWKPLPIIFHFAPPGLEIYASPRPNQPSALGGKIQQ